MSSCSFSLYGNGQCDFTCNNEACNFDNGDCADFGDYVGCPPEGSSYFCSASDIGNGVCDFRCNNEDCHFDGGECAEYADYVGCGLSSSCTRSNSANGYCDLACFNEECNYDGGDCGDRPHNCSTSSCGTSSSPYSNGWG